MKMKIAISIIMVSLLMLSVAVGLMAQDDDYPPVMLTAWAENTELPFDPDRMQTDTAATVTAQAPYALTPPPLLTESAIASQSDPPAVAAAGAYTNVEVSFFENNIQIIIRYMERYVWD